MDEKRILIVEDEKPISSILQYGFSKEGFDVRCAFTGSEALSIAREFLPQVVLLDWMLPDISGVDICRMITETLNIPIIMLTAKGTVDDKLYGLEAGADDYITKPFDLREVIARVKTVLRRFEKAETNPESDHLVIGNITICENERMIIKDGQEVDLTPKEFDLYLFFIKHPRQVFTRLILLEQIWGYDYLGDTRTVDIHVQRLRKKLDLSRHLQTVFGVGYKYVPLEP
ncbi:MAG: response regulator transcription factor [Lachnospiraceae bacterium]|jgi:two-component system alkaline phosphatase synthesis response regulator PhoP|nr:response regulator transcription factor [Lachnospiraceae bacterium]